MKRRGRAGSWHAIVNLASLEVFTCASSIILSLGVAVSPRPQNGAFVSLSSALSWPLGFPLEQILHRGTRNDSFLGLWMSVWGPITLWILQKMGFYIELIHPFPNVFSRVKLEGSASNYTYLLWPLIAHLLWQPQRGCYWNPCGTSRGGEGLKIEVEKGFIMAGITPHHIYVPNSSRGVSGFLSQASGSANLCGSVWICGLCSASSTLTGIF